MSDAQLHSETEGGITAEHPVLPVAPALVAATHSGKEHNAIRPALVPFACFRAGDMRFQFESSFVRPGLAAELGALKKLIDKHTLPDEQGKPKHQPALTVFGHADPTGSDDFNKALSGRRAQAVYGLLTRKTELWEELFNNPADHWGKPALGIMLDTLSSAATQTPVPGPQQPPASASSSAASSQAAPVQSPPDDPEREKQIKRLEQDPAGRKKLFKTYMDFVCVEEVFRLEPPDQARLKAQGVAIADRLGSLLGKEFASEDDFLEAVRRIAQAGELAQDEDTLVREARKRKPYVVAPEDFLAEGKDKGGKGDFQGCGEFNPVFLQSQKDIDEFESVPASAPDKPAAKQKRDDANEPDRRVLIFLFRPGIRINPEIWPCPRAKEGTGGCRKRFFSDGDARRNKRLPDQPRKFDETKNTFACRFYDRLANKSPCEQTLSIFQIRLFDRRAQPLPHAPFIHNARGAPQPGRAGPDAFITLRDLKIPTTVHVKWSRPKPGDGPGSPPPRLTEPMEFELDVQVSIPNGDSDEAALNRLRNLGYNFGPRNEDDIRAFKNDYKGRFPEVLVDGKVDGTLNEPTKKVIKKVHDACDPVVKTTPVPPKPSK